MNIEAIIKELQPKFFALAYRMTGEISVSQDMVQDVISQWAVNPRADVQNIGGYLSRSLTNRCLLYLSRIKKERAAYKGHWLPEPMVSKEIMQFELKTDLTYGFMVMMGKLAPTERAVFLLKEGFDVEYSELSEMLSLNQANCRQLYHRAKEKLAGSKKRFSVNWPKHSALLDAFHVASRTGDVGKIVGLLRDDIAVCSDGGGIVSAALHTINGIDHVTRFFEGLAKKGQLYVQFNPVYVNGELGILLYDEHTGQLKATLVFSLLEDRINAIYILMNPHKMAHVHQLNISEFKVHSVI